MLGHAYSARAEWRAWVGPLLLALGLRVWLASRSHGLTMDSGLYAHMADLVRAGKLEPLGPAHHGYPALIALASFVVSDREWTGRVVSMVAGLLLVPLVYQLARRRMSVGWSAMAASLVALHPLLAMYSTAIMTEASFVLIAYAALAVLERGRALAGGAGLGFAYWIRPEALVIALGAVGLMRGAWRSRVVMLASFVVAASPFFVALRIERGAWMLTPKEVLVAAPLPGGVEPEPSLDRPVPDEHIPLAERTRAALPSALPRYLPNLTGHLRQIHDAWPLPLLVLSAIGLARRRGVLLAPLVQIAILPLLAVVANGRFPMLLVPALAVGAAEGAAWMAERHRRFGERAAWAPAALALIGLAWSWLGPPGLHVRRFDEQPMDVMREAGLWLRARGPSDARVMDRKAFIPFFAGMRHVQLPEGSVEQVVEHGIRVGANYLALEEYVLLSLRPQLLPLLTDPEFLARHSRLRLVFVKRDRPYRGVAIFELVRDSTSASSGGR